MKKFAVLSAAAAFAMFAMAGAVSADENQISPNNFTTVIDDKSIGQSDGFYDIKWTPGYEGTIKMLINNDTDVAKSYKVSMNKATTNRNGVIEYNSDRENNLEDPLNISTMIQGPELIEVAPHTEEELVFTMKMPDEKVDGVKLGGITLMDAKQEGEAQKMAYAFPVVIKGENETPEHKITFGAFEFESIGAGMYSVKTPFKNEGTNWFNSSNLSVKVEDARGNVILEEDKTVSISPESNVDYAASFEREIPAGIYNVTLHFKSNLVDLVETQEVTISKSQAKDIKETVNIGPKASNDDEIYQYIMIVTIAVLLGFSVGVVSSKKK